ncbi:DUF805 domain-containing protein [Nostocoides sp. HKS02]|uniref:DUF805 domain-containing protein n=1 Tax=Nostocoides sp. HKS02 TaxID=1813880 RepID=UPI0012B4B355|nr:DUF805 domain-containing protein [Tetrasphaera sp. HKS02]QGN57388.1 DUF805 domain-containing protein [Tetrasphaera sp. HKS02]
MSFADSVRSALTQYATFTGRARRSEYWWFQLFVLGVYAVAAIIDVAVHSQVVAFVALVALLLPSIAVSVRRLHDTNRSGWWYLISLIPFGGIVLLVFFVQDSAQSPNAHGISPKAVPVPIA